MNTIYIIYVDLLIANEKQFSQIPLIVKENVDKILQDYLNGGKLTREQYEEIINK